MRLPVPVRELARMLLVYLNNRHDPLYREWYFNHAPALKQFRDKHAGADCFIIGNGPSLNRMDLSPLRNYYTFGLNKIYLMSDQVDLNLSYHVSVNPLVIEQSAKDFEALSCDTFLSYRAAHAHVRALPHVRFIYTGGPFTFQRDIQQRIFEGHTVTFVAMQIAFYMGFERVFLIGVDHSFSVEGEPNEKQLLKGDDLNHFDPNYFGGQEWQLPDLEASELSYHLARFFYRRAGRKIMDATVGGKLQTYPKISYEEALDTCQPQTSAERIF